MTNTGDVFEIIETDPNYVILKKYKDTHPKNKLYLEALEKINIYFDDKNPILNLLLEFYDETKRNWITRTCIGVKKKNEYNGLASFSNKENIPKVVNLLIEIARNSNSDILVWEDWFIGKIKIEEGKYEVRNGLVACENFEEFDEIISFIKDLIGKQRFAKLNIISLIIGSITIDLSNNEIISSTGLIAWRGSKGWDKIKEFILENEIQRFSNRNYKKFEKIMGSISIELRKNKVQKEYGLYVWRNSDKLEHILVLIKSEIETIKQSKYQISFAKRFGQMLGEIESPGATSGLIYFEDDKNFKIIFPFVLKLMELYATKNEIIALLGSIDEKKSIGSGLSLFKGKDQLNTVCEIVLKYFEEKKIQKAKLIVLAEIIGIKTETETTGLISVFDEQKENKKETKNQKNDRIEQEIRSLFTLLTLNSQI